MARLVRLIILGFLGTPLALQVAAQATTSATCTTDLWTFNKEAVSPCIVAAALQAACNNGRFMVPALPSGGQYSGPLKGEANSCSCSTVTYCMIAACAACQGKTTETWPTWKTNCSADQVTVGWYPVPIPSGVGIPAWAYLNVSASNTWDAAAASALHVAGGVESYASGYSATATAAGATGSSPRQNSKVTAIAGGVTAGLVGLSLIGGLIFLLFRRNKRKRHNAPSSQYIQSVQLGGEKFDPALAYQHRLAPTPVPCHVNLAPGLRAPPLTKLYDPSDPSTFPSPQEAISGFPGYSSPAPSSTTFGAVAPATSYRSLTPDSIYGSRPSSSCGLQAPTHYGAPPPFVSYHSSSSQPFSQQLFGGSSSGYTAVPTASQQFGTPRTPGAALGYNGTPEV
ncbi:hypothetical protein JB92DRAFT_3130675 [Gautieria morchelliformis]|nr:hypothetical protein JB92DRAFT_3130675 [Gautieria morchelliformis]